jgi:hypothetical protein
MRLHPTAREAPSLAIYLPLLLILTFVHLYAILFNELVLKIQPFSAVFSLRHRENNVFGANCPDKPLQLPMIRVTRVVHLEVEGEVGVVLVTPPREYDENRRLLLFVDVFEVHLLQILYGFNVDPALRGVSGEEIWLQIHKAKLAIAVFINYDQSFKVLGQINKDLFLPQEISEEEYSEVFMLTHYFFYTIVSLFPAGEIVCWVSECVIKEQVINRAGDSLHIFVSFFGWEQILIGEHARGKSEIPCVQDSPEFTFEEDHHSAWAMTRIH